MKKFLFLLFVLSNFISISSQTVLNRFPLELKKSKEYFQILNAENKDQEYFTFITDKQKVTVIKYNSALFFSDSLSVSRPDNKFDFMAGATFNAAGNPNLYWASKDFETIKLIHFDFKNHSASDLIYENDFKREKVIDAFVADNKFNIVSITSDNNLKFTTFSNSGKEEQILVTASENFTMDPKFRAAISDYGIVVIDKDVFTPLYVGVSKIKRYLNAENYFLTIDLDTSTTLITVNLKDFTLKKDDFPYAKSDKNSGSNSFINQDVLYQISAHAESISLSGVHLKTKNIVATYEANAVQEIDFKNSPLFIQSDSGKTRELKNTSKLLSKIDFKNVGLSIYSTPNYNLFTIGGVREVVSGGHVALGFGVVVLGAFAGGFADPTFLMDRNNMQSIYFESYFDKDFKHVKSPFRPLYIDALGVFLNTNRPTTQNVYPFKNFVILNYYDTKNKEFVMRKFEDVKD